MFRFIFILAFMVFILMFLAGFSVVRTFRQILFGGGSNNKKTQQRKQTTRNNSGQQSQKNSPPPPQKKKIIAKDEGEYVDYEEVKD